MHDIQVIFTTHHTAGKCNSIELLRLIEKVKPEIVFEELSTSNFEKAYKESSLETVETKAIKKYLNSHRISHFPVDTYRLPNDYHINIDYMLAQILNCNSNDSKRIRQLLDMHKMWMVDAGFILLNSMQNEEIFEEIKTLKEKILVELNEEHLYKIASMEKEVINNREVEILNNIYKFSMDNIYNKAILFIGSAHRKSLIKKVETFKSQENIEINWVINDALN